MRSQTHHGSPGGALTQEPSAPHSEGSSARWGGVRRGRSPPGQPRKERPQGSPEAAQREGRADPAQEGTRASQQRARGVRSRAEASRPPATGRLRSQENQEAGRRLHAGVTSRPPTRTPARTLTLTLGSLEPRGARRFTKTPHARDCGWASRTGQKTQSKSERAGEPRASRADGCRGGTAGVLLVWGGGSGREARGRRAPGSDLPQQRPAGPGRKLVPAGEDPGAPAPHLGLLGMPCPSSFVAQSAPGLSGAGS